MAYINRKITVKIDFMLCGIVLVIGVIALMIVLPVHSFLAVSKPVKADVLIIESWLSDSALMETARLHTQNYPHILIVGFPSLQRRNSPSGLSVRDYLCHLGVDDSLMHNLVVPPVGQKRTLSFAVAVKQWLLKKEAPRCIGCNVVSDGVHARKTLIVYERSLSGIVPVGVLAAQPSEYNPDYWWLSVVGWGWVVFGMIKYLRAFIFGY